MGMTRSFFSGWYTAITMPGVLLLKWLLNMLFAAALGGALLLLLERYAGNSKAVEELITGLRLDVWTEFLAANGQVLYWLQLAALLLGLVYALFQIFLTGGILQVAVDRKRLPWNIFFAACAVRFIPLLIIALQSAILFAVIVVLPHIGLARLHDWFTQDVTSSLPSFYFTWVWFAIILLLFLSVARVNDYARTFLFLYRTNNPIWVFAQALAFVTRKPVTTLILWIALIIPSFAFGAGFIYLVGEVEAYFGPTSVAALAITFGAAQVLIVLRVAAGIARLAGQLRFAESRVEYDPWTQMEPSPTRSAQRPTRRPAD